jgi:hypothetical protein
MRKKLVFGLLTLGATVLVTQADIIPTLSQSPTATTGGFTWNYSTNVTVDETVQHGDFFTIYDFGSIAPNSNMQPAGWTFSTALTGTDPSNVTPKDNPNLLNLTWRYTGTTPISGAAALGNFSVIAASNQLRTGDFAAEATRNSGSTAGTKIDNVGQVSVPVPEMSTLLPILSVCGAGLMAGVPGLLRRRKA